MLLNQLRSRSRWALLVGVVSVVGALFASASASAAVTPPPNYQSTVFATGGTLTNPDDITRMDGVIYVTYQNGTQADGSGGNSTIVGYRPDGTQAGSWTLAGRCDGLTADHDRLIATVNEDANSSLYTIRPKASPTRQLRHYTYAPDPATLSGGGTDAISIVDGKILISASNPSPTTAGGSTFAGPAAYAAKIPPRGTVATLTPVFNDNSPATNAVTGQQVTLNLSDPDSNAAVPQQSPQFRGDFMLDSQGDSELVFDRHPGRPHQSLTLLPLTSAAGPPQVDDVSWSTSQTGTLFVVDQGADQIDAISGPFGWGTVLTAIPSGSPLSGDVGTVDLPTGTVTPFATGFDSPKGLLFVSARGGHGHRHGRGDHGHQDHGHDSGSHGHQHG